MILEKYFQYNLSSQFNKKIRSSYIIDTCKFVEIIFLKTRNKNNFKKCKQNYKFYSIDKKINIIKLKGYIKVIEHIIIIN